MLFGKGESEGTMGNFGPPRSSREVNYLASTEAKQPIVEQWASIKSDLNRTPPLRAKDPRAISINSRRLLAL